ncbi:MAG: hypothetical protein JF592_12700 [Microbacterium sp.]|uniref:DUF6993 domain-containing protein n=1 Tax=Microbacterium natoriense TaxID=284570 RepID=A0AAW8EXE6_9MICO|nr:MULTISPECIES: hypothetical protein [Microbacterium]MBW8763426.1 hypothetical protein [Microbacterium sp.]MDQ0648206.1 hypothetical protein [Microbacterium natoriense]
MLRRPASSASRIVLSGAAAAMILVLSACAPTSTPTPTTTDGAQESPTAPPSSEGPVLVADGSAADNLPLFTAVTAQVWSTDQRVSGRAYIDALIAAGFDRAAMQVTQDQSTVGNAAETLQFSVRWGETECLVGQVGPSTGEPVTVVLPQLAEGRCLVGSTRAIDW